jgi:hypothetical protein
MASNRSATEPEPTIRFLPEDLVDRVPDPGWYPVAVAGVWKRPVETTGSTAVKVKFVITEGAFEDAELWDQFVVEGAESPEGEAVARRRLARLLRACGVIVEPDVDVPLKGIEGSELVVKIVPEMFQGQPKARIKSFRPLHPSGPGKASEDEKTPF